MSGTKLTPFGASASGSVSVGAGGSGGTGVPFLSASTEQRLMNVEGRLRMLEQSLQGQRLRADTAEAEFARIKDVSDNYYALLVDANQKLAAAEQRIAELEADKARIDWLEEQPVDTLYLDDGRIIDIAGRIDLRKAIDNAIFAALNPKPEAESHE